MNVTLVNNHVLFALNANRKFQPEWSRRWQNEIASAVTVAETRRGLRVQPLLKLGFQITPANLAEQIELNECVMAARKSGLACAPYHGRSSQLQDAAFAATSLTVDNNFTWAIGDWIFLRGASGVETRQITDADLVADVWTLDLSDPLDGDYASGALIWPLLFGEFDCEDMAGLSPKTGPIKISIAELVSARTAQVGEVEAPGGDGIGVWKIGDTFVVQ